MTDSLAVIDSLKTSTVGFVIFGLHWPPADIAEWAFWLSVASLLGNIITFFVLRWERVVIKVNQHYRVSLERDRYLYPRTIGQQGLQSGEECCLLTITYRGRHSVALESAAFEMALSGLHPFNPTMRKATLYDGQSLRVLFAERMVPMRDITAFVIHTGSHGVRIKRVNRFRRFQYRNMLPRYWLYTLLQRVTGVPEPPHAWEPKRCPKCRAGRDRITFEERLVSDQFNHRNRRFTCGKCKHQWSADTFKPEPPADASATPPAAS